MSIPLVVTKEVRRSTDHIMGTTRYSDQQGSKSRQKVMRLYKQWRRPMSKRLVKPPYYSISRATSIDSNCCLRPAFSATKRTNYAPISFDQGVKFLKVTHRTGIRKIEIPRSMVVEALSWWSRRASQHPVVQSPVHPWKSPMNLARSPLLVALVGRNTTVVRDYLFPYKPPGSHLWFSRTGVQHSPGSSTIELPSAFAESDAYPPDRALPGSPRQCSLPLACRHTSGRAPNWSSEEACTWKHHPQPTIPPPCLNPTGRIAKAASWLHLSRVSPALHPPERPSDNRTPKPGFRGRGHEMCTKGIKLVWSLCVVPCTGICMYVCMVITYSRVWINRVRLPILLVVSWTGKMNIPLSPCVPENLVSRDGFSCPAPRQPAHLHTQAESGAYLRDSSRVPRRRPWWNRHTPSGQSRVYGVTQLRTDGVHCREFAGTGLVNLKVVPNGCCRCAGLIHGRSSLNRILRLLSAWAGAVLGFPISLLNQDWKICRRTALQIQSGQLIHRAHY